MSRRLALAALLCLGLAGCGGGEEAANTVYPVETRPLTPEGTVIPEQASVTLQLPGPAGERFAGYYAAKDQGYYDGVKLDVAIEPRAGGAPAEQVVGSAEAELGVGRLPALLAARERGADLVNIAQVFSRTDGLLEDGVFARTAWLADPVNSDIAVRFLQASFMGWAFCRDRAADCAAIVAKRVPGLEEARAQRLVDDVNARIWPNETGVGTMDPAAFRRTARLAHARGLTESAAPDDAWRDDLALLAVAQGEDEELDDGSGAHFDLRGTYWQAPGG